MKNIDFENNKELRKAARDYFYSKRYQDDDVYLELFNEHSDDIKDTVVNFFNKDVSIKSKGDFGKALDEAFTSPGYHLDKEIYQNGKQYIYDELSNFARTDEAKDMILNHIYKGSHIDTESFLRANAKGFEGETVSHGLFAFDNYLTENNFGKNANEQIKNNLKTIVTEGENIEIAAASSNYAIGEIGIFGKAKNAKYAFASDMSSTRNSSTNTRKHGIDKYGIDDTISDYIEEYKDIGKFRKLENWRSAARHDEVITGIGEIESLWVKKDYFNKNKDFVTSLMKEYDIKNLDVIDAKTITENIQGSKIERFSYDDLIKSASKDSTKYLSSKEAFEKYGPNSDEFYTSQGLDPKEQRKAINKLNSKKKPKLSDEQISSNLHKESEEAANQFYKTSEEAKQLINNLKENNKTHSKPEIKSEAKKLSEPKTKPEPSQKIETPKKPKPKVTEKPKTDIPNGKLTNKTLNKASDAKKISSKVVKSLPKGAKIGLGLIAGATIIAGIAGASGKNKDKKESREERIKNKIKQDNNNNNVESWRLIGDNLNKDKDENKSDKKESKADRIKNRIKQENNNNNVESWRLINNDVNNARDISQFSRGHSTYNLR